MLKSVCRVRLFTYQFAFAMARRILDWDLCMMTILDLLAQPQSSIPLLRVDLITALYMSNLYSMDRRDFFSLSTS